jgi:hypothetical protein
MLILYKVPSTSSHRNITSHGLLNNCSFGAKQQSITQFVFHIFVFYYCLQCRKEFGFLCLLRRSRAQIGRSVLFVRKTNMIIKAASIPSPSSIRRISRGIGISLILANSEIFFEKVLYPDFGCVSCRWWKDNPSAFQLNIWDIVYNTLQSISLFNCLCLFVFHIFVFDYCLLCRKEFD